MLAEREGLKAEVGQNRTSTACPSIGKDPNGLTISSRQAILILLFLPCRNLFSIETTTACPLFSP
jgi:hypothetical protein